MARFEKKYAGERRQAMFRAHFEHDITYAEIARRAKSGELVKDDPFDIPPQYVGELCRAEKDRRAGRYDSPLAEKPHRDSIEQLRRGCIGAADDLLTDYRAMTRKKPGQADPKRLAEIIKMVLLAASIPAPNEEAPLAPGQQKDGKRPSGERIRHGETGALLRAMQDEAKNGESPAETGLSEAAAS